MSDFVVDSSVTMAWAFEDETDAYADRVLDAMTSVSARVPPVWPLEVANVLAVAERRGRIDPSRMARFVRLLQALPIHEEPMATQEVLHQVLEVARQHRLSAYDASYLHLAMARGIPLATTDQALRQAARVAGVGIWGEESP